MTDRADLTTVDALLRARPQGEAATVRFLAGSVYLLPRPHWRRGRPTFVVVDPVVVGISLCGASLRLTIPAQTETDGLSLPWPLSRVWSTWGVLGLAGAFHDHLLAAFTDAELPKREADAFFLLALYALGATDLQAVTMFAGVRLARNDDRRARQLAPFQAPIRNLPRQDFCRLAD